MRKSVLVGSMMALGVASAGLAATVPGAEAHRRTVVDHIALRCGESSFVKALCGGVISFAAANLHYQDFRLFSVGRIGEVETLGALGAVVVVRND